MRPQPHAAEVTLLSSCLGGLRELSISGICCLGPHVMILQPLLQQLPALIQLCVTELVEALPWKAPHSFSTAIDIHQPRQDCSREPNWKG